MRGNETAEERERLLQSWYRERLRDLMPRLLRLSILSLYGEARLFLFKLVRLAGILADVARWNKLLNAVRSTFGERFNVIDDRCQMIQHRRWYCCDLQPPKRHQAKPRDQGYG